MQCKYVEYKWEKPKTCAHGYLVPAILKIIKEIGLPSDAKILDAGCGGGSLEYSLYNDLGLKNIYGFDASRSGIELAKKCFPELAKNFFIHNAYEDLPSDVPQIYDLIISMEIIEHLYDPEAYLKKVYTWLKENGYLIVTTPYHGYLKNLAISLLGKFDRHFNPLFVGGHIKFFSKKTITEGLNQTGFKLIKFTGCGRIPYIWKSMILLAKKL